MTNAGEMLPQQTSLSFATACCRSRSLIDRMGRQFFFGRIQNTALLKRPQNGGVKPMTIHIPLPVLVLGIVGAVGAAIAAQLPELRRYLKIEAM